MFSSSSRYTGDGSSPYVAAALPCASTSVLHVGTQLLEIDLTYAVQSTFAAF